MRADSHDISLNSCRRMYSQAMIEPRYQSTGMAIQFVHDIRLGEVFRVPVQETTLLARRTVKWRSTDAYTSESCGERRLHVAFVRRGGQYLTVQGDNFADTQKPSLHLFEPLAFLVYAVNEQCSCALKLFMHQGVTSSSGKLLEFSIEFVGQSPSTE